VATVHERLDQGNSPWADYDASRASLTQAMKKLGFDRR
jgi:bifunctional non-homologous end joining protein LigD